MHADSPAFQPYARHPRSTHGPRPDRRGHGRTGRSRAAAMLAALAVAIVVGTGTTADANDGEAPIRAPRIQVPPIQAPRLRLVHLMDGLRSASPKQDLRRLKDADIFKRAKATGLDLRMPGHDLVAQHFADGRVFYVFYKTADINVRARPYLIQRIKKTVRNWKTLDGTPEEVVTYQVEVFKTFGGALKRPDQHYGSFHLRGFAKREVVKEYEIGVGEIPDLCEGKAWPFDPGRLYELPQAYGPEIGIYDQVVFASATTWGLHVSLDEEGAYAIRSPELGIDAPAKLPERRHATPLPLDDSDSVVLKRGVGVATTVLGESTPGELRDALGETIQVRSYASGSRNLVFARGLTVNVAPNGKAKTVMTRPGFLGRTEEGIGHGSTRAEVMTTYGVPRAQLTDAATWSYPGLVLWFDGYHTVDRLVVVADREARTRGK